MSSGSSGPARQASWPVAVSPGSSRPRAVSRRACRAAAPQQAVAGWAAGSCRARTRSGRASSSGRDSARGGPPPDSGAVPSYDGELGLLTLPRPSAGRGAPSGSQKAIRPSRGRGAGRKTAASRTETVSPRRSPVLGHHGPVSHTSCHLPPACRISRLRLYGRGLTIGPGDGPGPARRRARSRHGAGDDVDLRGVRHGQVHHDVLGGCRVLLRVGEALPGARAANFQPVIFWSRALMVMSPFFS